MAETNLTPTGILKPLRWGRAATASPSVSLESMLKGLQLLSDDDDRQTAATTTDPWADTPASVQVIRAGVLGSTKRLTAWITGVGGVSSALAVVTATVGKLNDALTPTVVATLIAAAGIVLAAAFISIAMLAASDIRARGDASSARHHARADVASAFMAGTAGMCEHTMEVPSFVARSYVPLEDIKGLLKEHEDTARIRKVDEPGFHRIKHVSDDHEYVLMQNHARVQFKDIAEVSL